MSQSLVQIYSHIVFSTKNREPFLQDRALRAEMHAYLGGVCEKHLSPVLAVGGTEDHAHILCRLAKNVSVEEILRDMKRASS